MPTIMVIYQGEWGWGVSERDEYTALHSPGFEATLLITNSSPIVS